MMAVEVGCRRQLQAIREGRHDLYGYDGDEGWSLHIEGAAGELAVAKALDRYWSGSVNTYRAGADVGQLQVRTRSQPNYDLLIRDRDDDDAVFVLVTGRVPSFAVRGWLLGRDGKRPEWRREHGGRPPAYFVPQAHLRPITELEDR
jgi:hypothetical protein